jgi:hypothetical protein
MIFRCWWTSIGKEHGMVPENPGIGISDLQAVSSMFAFGLKMNR